MSTAAEYDEWDRQYCCHERDCGCWDEPAAPSAAADPGLGELLGGPAADAMFGLGIIRDVPAGQVPPVVMLQAVLGAQRLISWAKAQQHRWTAALVRPGVAVPVSDLLDSIAHRGDEPGRDGDVPEDLAERAAAGTEVVGDEIWDALVAAEATSLAEPELSAAWLVAPITARRRIADAQVLVEELPDTFTALEQGRIEEVRARIIAETTAVLDPQLRHRAEQLILDRARRGMSPGDLRRMATKIVADLDPDAANKRAEQARGRRGTSIRDLGDDLARFTADLAAEDAALTEGVLDLLAQAIPPEARHGRGNSQLRADIFADLFGQLADTGLIDLRVIHPDTDTGRADTGRPDRDRADRDPADPDVDQEAAADTDEPGHAHPGESEETADGSPPTAAELWARLRSVDGESRPEADPDCERRGGLLSMISWPAGVRVNLDVTAALSTLAGCDDLSARLTGLGVLTADTARALANAAGTVRILVTNDPPDTPPHSPTPPDRGPRPPDHGGIHHHSPDCGTILDFGRTTYRSPAPVTDFVDTRDQRCRFPGCATPATRCDHDHRTPWDAGGATCPCNLDALCRYHHRIKTFASWQATRDHGANTLTWISPLGQSQTDRPAPDLPTGTPLNLNDGPHGGPPDLDSRVHSRSSTEISLHVTEFKRHGDLDEPPF